MHTPLQPMAVLSPGFHGRAHSRLGTAYARMTAAVITAIAGHCTMHLPDRGGRQWLEIETFEPLLPAFAISLSHHPPHLAFRHGVRRITQHRQRISEFARQKVRAFHRQQLSHLHRGAAHAGQTSGQFLRIGRGQEYVDRILRFDASQPPRTFTQPSHRQFTGGQTEPQQTDQPGRRYA